MKRRFAIRSRAEVDIAQLEPQLRVVVNLAVGDQDRTVRLVDWLIPGARINDCEPGAYQSNRAGNMAPGGIGTPMRECLFEQLKDPRLRRAAVAHHHASNSAHCRFTNTPRHQPGGYERAKYIRSIQIVAVV